MKATLRLVDFPSLRLGDFSLISSPVPKFGLQERKKRKARGKKEAKMIDFNGFCWRKNEPSSLNNNERASQCNFKRSLYE